MSGVAGVAVLDDDPVWSVTVQVLFEDAEPHTTAEFTASCALSGDFSVHTSSEADVDDFMGMLAEAMSNVSGRICYVTLNKVSLASQQVFTNAA